MEQERNCLFFLFVFHTPLFYALHNSSELGSALAYRKGSYFIRHFSTLCITQASLVLLSLIEKVRLYKA